MMLKTENSPPRVAVHKFSSCDGCQLAFLNLGENLLALAEAVEIVHFAEAGIVAVDAEVDIAFVEGSIYTPEDQKRIERIRQLSGMVITIGACATSGGIQALRNIKDSSVDRDWVGAIYASPQHIETLSRSTPIKEYIKVDFEIWGCPISSTQLVAVVHDLLRGVSPSVTDEPLCQTCKRQQIVCTLITQQQACLGPVTRAGCGAICPAMGRECYGCSGTITTANSYSLSRCFSGLGLLPEQIARRMNMIHSEEEKKVGKGGGDE